jgi:hypothetical protein
LRPTTERVRVSKRECGGSRRGMEWDVARRGRGRSHQGSPRPCRRRGRRRWRSEAGEEELGRDWDKEKEDRGE